MACGCSKKTPEKLEAQRLQTQRRRERREVVMQAAKEQARKNAELRK